jgi:hypothetical protein
MVLVFSCGMNRSVLVLRRPKFLKAEEAELNKPLKAEEADTEVFMDKSEAMFHG